MTRLDTVIIGAGLATAQQFGGAGLRSVILERAMRSALSGAGTTSA